MRISCHVVSSDKGLPRNARSRTIVCVCERTGPLLPGSVNWNKSLRNCQAKCKLPPKNDCRKELDHVKFYPEENRARKHTNGFVVPVKTAQDLSDGNLWRKCNEIAKRSRSTRRNEWVYISARNTQVFVILHKSFIWKFKEPLLLNLQPRVPNTNSARVSRSLIISHMILKINTELPRNWTTKVQCV